MKKLWTACLLILMCISCTDKDNTVVDISTDDANTTTQEFDADDLNTDASNGIQVSLLNDHIETESNLTYKNGRVSITEAGTYVFKGTLDNGQIYVATDALVHIILDGVTIQNNTGPAIEVRNAKKVVITLVDENTLTDGTDYTLYTNDDEPNATLYSKADLSLNGTGTLNINATYSHGILSKDVLKIVSGTYQITAVNDAIRGRDGIAILDGTYNLIAQVDGLQANNTDLGWIEIYGGTYNIEAKGDGIQAEDYLLIEDGTFNITSQEKGLVSMDLSIMDGNYTLNTIDDSLHANGNITIDNGQFTINSEDDAIHADEDLTIKNGIIDIESSYEGLEGSNVTIHNGEITLVSSDDGINAAGGNDTAKDPRDFFAGGDHAITINGGMVIIYAQGDGIDANGNLYIKGGTVLVHGPSGAGNGALDYDGEGIITGGDLIAYGSGGMSQSLSNSSTQNVLEIKTNKTHSENTTIEILDENNQVVIALTSEKSFSSVVFSSDALIKNQSYTLWIDGSQTGSFILSDTLTSINEYGAAQSGQNYGGPRR